MRGSCAKLRSAALFERREDRFDVLVSLGVRERRVVALQDDAHGDAFFVRLDLRTAVLVENLHAGEYAVAALTDGMPDVLSGDLLGDDQRQVSLDRGEARWRFVARQAKLWHVGEAHEARVGSRFDLELEEQTRVDRSDRGDVASVDEQTRRAAWVESRQRRRHGFALASREDTKQRVRVTLELQEAAVAPSRFGLI